MTDSKEAILEKVAGSEGEKVKQIATGAEHSAFITGTTLAISI